MEIDKMEIENKKTTPVYSIYDMKSELWSRPTFPVNEGSMIRSFMDLVNDKQHPVGQHPEDYALYKIAEWTDKEGKLFPLNPPLSIGTGINYVQSKESKG